MPEVLHCPSCGALVPVGADGARVCRECGHEFAKRVAISPRGGDQAAQPGKGRMVQRNVTTRRRIEDRVDPVVPAEVMSVEEVRNEGRTEVVRENDEVVSDDGHKKVVRRRKKRKRVRLGPLLFLGGWTTLVMGVILAVNYHNAADETIVEGQSKEESERKAALQLQMEGILRKELPACHAVLLNYLKEPTWARRAQFVCNSSEIAPKMGRHYIRNRLWKLPEGSKVTVSKANLVLSDSENPIVEAIFRVESLPVKGENGELAEEQPKPEFREVSFLRDGARWVIDWEALVRYSSNSWPLFRGDVEGSNAPGEFRLFVRRTTGRFEGGEPVLVLKFFEPRNDLNDMWRYGSPGVVVPLDSEEGQRLQEILEREPEDWEPGQPRLWHDDPEGLRRVRVKLAWERTADDRRILKVSEVLAGNWLMSGHEEDFREELPAEWDGDADDQPDQSDQPARDSPEGA